MEIGVTPGVRHPSEGRERQTQRERVIISEHDRAALTVPSDQTACLKREKLAFKKTREEPENRVCALRDAERGISA
ncbi:hypothetical protein chiPu_0008779 [Chiloscyllium punctatum]|uniref:Uncharacterized protein n=1 Tax=Chiloscyllium punctatum TaxID=137246 RepID=A0A401SIV5_CHIPU|nr:hypothetical protein [Chiloscyllium punctatum]